MTLIVDTSVWIEFFRGQADYHDALLPLIEQGKVLALECIFGELLQGARGERERLIHCRSRATREGSSVVIGQETQRGTA